MPKPQYVYLCGVDWQWEMDTVPVEVYPSVESLKKSRECWTTCGIVKLKVEEVEWVESQALFGDKK